MTPQLQQAIKLLQMSNVELAEYIEHEIEENPILEREDAEAVMDIDGGHTTRESGYDAAEASDTGDFGAEREDVRLSPDDPAYDDYDLLPDSADHATSKSIGDDDRALDTDYENTYEPESASDGASTDSLMWNAPGGGFNDDLNSLENFAADGPKLRDDLIAQIQIDFEDPLEMMIASRLIEMLDANGWLAGDLEPVAVALGCDLAKVEGTLALCQKLDPPGVFARSLSECLALQLRAKDRLDPAMQALIDNLGLLGKRDFVLLRKLCGVDTADLLQMVTEIKKLNPRPASLYDHDIIQPVVPDVFVRRSAEGWLVELNADAMPRVLVNTRYYAVVSRQARSASDRAFLADRLQSANWLVRALHQRAETILKVAAQLVKQQEAFLERGVAYLKPLTLRDVAEAVGVHESTVSRVTANKYLGMSQGIFEMKYFFTSAIGLNKDGESRSAEAIRFRIKSLIDGEKPELVLSDDRIVDILREEGIEIARRTVAKYRDAMRIPSSVQRRRENTLRV